MALRDAGHVQIDVLDVAIVEMMAMRNDDTIQLHRRHPATDRQCTLTCRGAEVASVFLLE